MSAFWIPALAERSRRFTVSLERPVLFNPSLRLHPGNIRCLHPTFQIRPFIFNNFQDAPPATSFLSTLCIVAWGWVSPLPILFRYHLNSLSVRAATGPFALHLAASLFSISYNNQIL